MPNLLPQNFFHRFICTLFSVVVVWLLLSQVAAAQTSVRVQSGSLSLTGVTQDVTIDPVVLENTWVRHTARIDDGPRSQDVTAELVGSTTLRFTRYSSVGTLEIEWFAVEDAAATVERGTTTVASGALTATQAITTVDQTNTFVIISNRTNEVSEFTRSMYGAYFSADDELTFERLDSGAESVIAWEVVTLNDATVQSGSTTLTAADSSASESITEVATSSTFVVAHGASSLNNLDHRHVRVDVPDATTVDFARDTADGTHLTTWYVVEVPRYDVQAVESGATSADEDITIDAISTVTTWTLGTSENSGGGESSANSKYTLSLPDSTTWRRDKESTSQNTQVTGYVITLNPATTLSGVVDQSDGATPLGAGVTVTATFDTTPPVSLSVTTDASGTFTITGVPNNEDSSPIPVILYLDNFSLDATTLTYLESDAGTVSDLALIADTTVATYASSTGDLLLTDFGFYDATDDPDILLRATGSVATTGSFLVRPATEVTGDGTTSSTVKISDGENGGPALEVGGFGDNFGSAVTSLGDLDGDGIPDLAVGAFGDEATSGGGGGGNRL